MRLKKIHGVMAVLTFPFVMGMSFTPVFADTLKWYAPHIEEVVDAPIIDGDPNARAQIVDNGEAGSNSTNSDRNRYDMGSRQIYSPNGFQVGHIEGGTIYSSNGSRQGRVDEYGGIHSPTGSYQGHIDSNGNIHSSNGPRTGYVGSH